LTSKTKGTAMQVDDNLVVSTEGQLITIVINMNNNMFA